MEFIRVQKIKYIGNKETNRYSNNVQLYVQPYFTEKDIITFIDLKTKQKTNGLKIHKMGVGKYTYYRFWSSKLSKHTDQYCMLMNVSKTVTHEIITKSLRGLDKYLLISNNEKKEPLLLIILNARLKEVLCYE